MVAPTSDDVMLELRDVAKSFGPVAALRAGSLRVTRGSIHALVGENGAGKSTLVKIVAGVHRRDAGDFLLGGERRLRLDRRVQGAGIAVIYQEPTLFPDLSVTENIFMGRQPLATGRRIDRAAMYAEAEALFTRLGVHIDPRRPALGPLDRRPADHRDRQGHLARRPRPDHGRADRGAQRRRGRPALRGRPQPARRGPRPGLHLAPLRRGLRPLRHRHRDARRRLHLHRAASPRPSVDEIVVPDGRPRGRRPVPQDPGAGRRARPARSRG